MNRSDRKKIKHLHRLHRRNKETLLSYCEWLTTYCWENDAQHALTDYLETLITDHGEIVSVRSQHPLLQERTPIHLPYLYRHQILFNDNTTIVLFQKFNFSRGFTSLFTSLTWSYMANLSTAFRRQHRRYETAHGRSFQLVHPNPTSLWENYKMFLTTLGTNWKNVNTSLHGPVWVVLTDVTAITVAVPGKKQNVGTSVYSHLIQEIHQHRFQHRRIEILGTTLAKTIRFSYQQKVAFIDVSLGNYIIDDQGRARFIDGELLQVLPDEVPSHYQTLELVLFMETLYLETVRDYCSTINSNDIHTINNYQQGVLLFFSAFLKELQLTKADFQLARVMYRDWSTKVGTFYFTVLLSFRYNSKVIRRYRKLLRKSLEKILEEYLSSSISDFKNF